VAAVKADTAAVLTDTGTTLDALIKDIPTVAEFEARTLLSADYVVVGDTLAAVTTVGSVTGAVGSVTGNVGGSVASVAANGITATSIAADAINASAVKADAVTKIQTGLATPTNITAGTITTVTNLTNAPTAGDLTATMKTSVTTAATAATPTAAAVTGAVGSVTGLTAGGIADAVWDEALAGHAGERQGSDAGQVERSGQGRAGKVTPCRLSMRSHRCNAWCDLIGDEYA
jgi:hypothetical protein